MEYFLKGIVAGFIIAVPIGPVAVLCFRRVLTERRMVGITTVLGAATADAIYGLLAAIGLKAVTHLLLVHHRFLHIFGGLLIVCIGAMMMRARPAVDRTAAPPRSLVGAFFSTMFLMLANPSIIISLLAVFAAIDLGEGSPGLDSVWISMGVFAGSAAWWFVYKLIALLVGERVPDRTLRVIDQVTGGVIALFGAWELVSSLIFKR